MMATTPGGSVFLGLREDADVDAFREEAERAESAGVAFDPDRYVVRHPAERHRLYLIPPGTPTRERRRQRRAGDKRDTVPLHLRFYDWLRRDGDGRLRQVHVDHAFANLDHSRRDPASPSWFLPRRRCARARLEGVAARSPSRSLLRRPPPRLHRRGRGRHEGRLPRPQPRRGRRHRDRDRVGRGPPLSFAETIVVPAAVRRTGCGASAAAAARS